MALEVKKIQSLSAQAIEDLKAIEKIDGLEHLAQLSDELKKSMVDENIFVLLVQCCHLTLLNYAKT